MKLMNFVILLLVSCLFIGCVADLQFYEAERKNTVAAYEEYLKNNPDSENSNMAHYRIISIKFDKAQQENTPEAYRSFLAEYLSGPDSTAYHVKLAKDYLIKAEQYRKELLVYKKGEENRNIDALKAYIKEYPNGQWVNDAVAKIEELIDPKLKEKYENSSCQAAERWVNSLDAGKWSEACKLASESILKLVGGESSYIDYLQTLRTIGKNSWIGERLFKESGEHKPLVMISRKIKMRKYFVKDKNRPIGDYMLFVYETVFENVSAEERVTMKKDNHSKWVNDGYVIHLIR